MATQLSVLQQRVQAWGYGLDTANQQAIFLNDAYRELAAIYPWKWTEKSAVFVTASQTIALTSFAADIRVPDALRAQATSTPPLVQYHMDWIPEQDIRELISHTAGDPGRNASPKYWSQWASSVLVYPAPDMVYSFTLDYIARPAALAVSTDPTVCPDEFDDLLVYAAVGGMSTRQRDWLTRDFASQKYEALLRRLMGDEMRKQRQTASHVQSSGLYQRSQIFTPRAWQR